MHQSFHALKKIWSKRWLICRIAEMYFKMARTDLLEMCSLGPSNPPPLQLPYLPIQFIILTLIVLSNPKQSEKNIVF